jgi:hypothetical protein
MKTFYFRNPDRLSVTERGQYSKWLDENTVKWDWCYPFASRREASIGITIHEESDCVAFALKFKCYKISWNNLNVIADDATEFYN